MRRLSRDASLADDLAQQVFIRVWRTLAQLQDPFRFPGWLKRLAVNVWLQHQRKLDVLADSEMLENHDGPTADFAGEVIDIDRALAMLPAPVRLCVVLSYHAEMSHGEIAETTGIPLGTVKSHIRRGTERLETLLSAYTSSTAKEAVS